MLPKTTIRVNGTAVSVEAPGEMPLLWVLRDKLDIVGPKYGCGNGSCGACTVHIDGRAATSCTIPLSSVGEAEVTTIEGLTSNHGRALQDAWVAEQVPQCGYCQPGQIMTAAALLDRVQQPTRDQIVEEMQSVICRCGTYSRILRAIERVAGTDVR